ISKEETEPQRTQRAQKRPRRESNVRLSVRYPYRRPQGFSLFVPFVSFVVQFLVVDPALAGPPGEVTYWKDIRQMLGKNCTVWPSALNQKEVDVAGGLALDSYDAVIKGGKSPVIQIGKSDNSEMVHLLVSKDDEKRMPLAATPLSADSI